MSRLCLICDKPLAECNKRPICFCHENEGRLSDRQIAELRKQNGHPENTKEESKEKAMRGTCDNCKRPDMAIQKQGELGKLCASCRGAIKGVDPATVPTVLEACRDKFSGKGKLRSGPKKKDDTESAQPAPAATRAVITAVDSKTKPAPSFAFASIKPFSVPCMIQVVTADGKIFMSIPGFIEIEGAA